MRLLNIWFAILIWFYVKYFIAQMSMKIDLTYPGKAIQYIVSDRPYRYERLIINWVEIEREIGAKIEF